MTSGKLHEGEHSKTEQDESQIFQNSAQRWCVTMLVNIEGGKIIFKEYTVEGVNWPRAELSIGENFWMNPWRKSTM